jgi:hypothetical protein
MEYCALDDAFPASMGPMPGCRGGDASASQRREERRKAKRCKGPQQTFLESDPNFHQRPFPDRQSLGPGESPSPMRGANEIVDPYNQETGLYEHQPLTADTAQGIMNDIIAKAPRSAYMARQPPPDTTAAKARLIETAGPTKLPSGPKPPAYFGADVLDDLVPNHGFGVRSETDGFVGGSLKSQEAIEGYANYNPIANDFNLEPNFSKTFGEKGANKAAGAELPIPSIVDAWKRLTPSGANTAFIEYLPPPGGELMPPTNAAPLQLGNTAPSYTYGGTDMKKRLDEIFSRLDDLENRWTEGSENSQMEIFLFILSGMFVMFSVDMFARTR